MNKKMTYHIQNLELIFGQVKMINVTEKMLKNFQQNVYQNLKIQMKILCLLVMINITQIILLKLLKNTIMNKQYLIFMIDQVLLTQAN